MERKTLNELIKEANLTHQQLADRLGVKRPMISQWNNPDSNPTSSTLIKLSRELNVSLKALLAAMGKDTTGIPDDQGDRDRSSEI